MYASTCMRVSNYVCVHMTLHVCTNACVQLCMYVLAVELS